MARKKNIAENTFGKKAQEPLSEERMRIVCRSVMRVLEAEKLYLKPDFSIWELSRAAGHGVKAVSRSINDYMGRKFPELITAMRVDESKRLLREAAESGKKVNISEIGEKSGFGCRTSYFSNFLQYEKMTPKEYMELYCGNKRPELPPGKTDK